MLSDPIAAVSQKVRRMCLVGEDGSHNSFSNPFEASTRERCGSKMTTIEPPGLANSARKVERVPSVYGKLNSPTCGFSKQQGVSHRLTISSPFLYSTKHTFGGRRPPRSLKFTAAIQLLRYFAVEIFYKEQAKARFRQSLFFSVCPFQLFGHPS